MNNYKKNSYFIGLLFLLAFVGLDAQTQYFYYYKGEKQYLKLDKTKLSVTVLTHFQKADKNNTEFEIMSLSNDLTTPKLMFGNIKLNLKFEGTKYEAIVNSLKSREDIVAVHPNFITNRNIKIGMSSYFYVKLKNVSDYDLLKKIAEQKKVIIVEQNKFLPLWYTLRCTKETPDNTLSIANYFYETGLFASAVPDFPSNDLACTNDSSFDKLWGLNNPTNPDIDINACAAWDITRGNGITVAVVDHGVELTHIDLQANLSPLSFDTETHTSPSKMYKNGDHGTHVAGIIGAVENDTLVVGVAPECTLISISNSLNDAGNSSILNRGDGINWAWRNGADVINNSWDSPVRYGFIDESIDSALIRGRNGKGCVVVFCSQNYGGAVSYPALLPNVIAVGAIADWTGGKRISSSNYGPELDVVAPGENITSTLPNNASAAKSGTSMACPHVSGVAALILSVNPNLTAKQVQDIIEQTAQKVGGYNYTNFSVHPNGTWHEEMGYGLVDAYAAVQKAICTLPPSTLSKIINTNETINGSKLQLYNTTIKSNTKLTINACEEVTLNAGFTVEAGAELEINLTP